MISYEFDKLPMGNVHTTCKMTYSEQERGSLMFPTIHSLQNYLDF